MVDITNVITVSTATQPQGLGFYNVNNVMCITDEKPVVPISVYAAYATARQVESDYGSASKVYATALKFFAQSPNVLTGNGQLLVAPLNDIIVTPAVAASGSVTFSALPVEGKKITVGVNEYTFSATAGEGVILIGDTLSSTLTNIAEAVWADVSAVSDALSKVTFTSLVAGIGGNSIVLACDDDSAVVSGANLSGGIDAVTTKESFSEAITRLYNTVYFGGLITSKALTAQEILDASDIVQTLDTIFVTYSNKTTDLEDGGLFATLADKKNTNTKGVLYTAGTDNTITAAYAGRAFSTNYNAQNTASTMNGKDLIGMLGDAGISQTILNKCKSLGVDVYTPVEGASKVFSFAGSGLFFDEVYNRLWFTQYLKVVYFNALMTVSTKVPQTEKGMNSIKNALRKACELAVYNGFLAPNVWNGSETFGNPEDFHRNIEEFGFFIYSMPVSQQNQTEREGRSAPVIQIAGKESGAIHSGSIIVNFER